MKKVDLEAILIKKPENIYYLSGFIGSNGQLYITSRSAYLITDFRYFRSAKGQIPKWIKIYDQAKGYEALGKNFKKIGIEQSYLTYEQVLRLRRIFKGISCKDISGWVEEMRMIKKDKEIRIMKEGVSIANKVYQSFLKTIQVGQSDHEMESRLYQLARAQGASGFSFDPIIAFGSDTANVHHHSCGAKLKKGQIILIDFGICYKKYMTDMTRVIFTKEPTQKQREIYDIVHEANERAIKLIKPGVKLSAIDAAARDYIAQKGYGNYFGHSTGHGVGLAIHEMPSIYNKSKELVQCGQVITIEPGIYTDKQGGVRIEDMVYINKKGIPEILTSSVSKDIKVLNI